VGSSSFLKKRTKKLLLLTLFERFGSHLKAPVRPSGQDIKVFWSFFSKKDCFPCLTYAFGLSVLSCRSSHTARGLFLFNLDPPKGG
jgi:hypothetical protein